MIRLIAIGSPALNDDISFRLLDHIGPYLVAKFPALAMCYLDRPGMQLVNEIRHCSCAILVDALVSPLTPGSVVAVREDDLDSTPTTLSSHDLSVADAIKLARQLKVLPEQVYIYGIGIDPAQSLTPQQFDQAREQLLQQLEALCTRVC